MKKRYRLKDFSILEGSKQGLLNGIPIDICESIFREEAIDSEIKESRLYHIEYPHIIQHYEMKIKAGTSHGEDQRDRIITEIYNNPKISLTHPEDGTFPAVAIICGVSYKTSHCEMTIIFYPVKDKLWLWD